MATAPPILLVCCEIGSSWSRFGDVRIQRNGFNVSIGNSRILLWPKVFRVRSSRGRKLRPSASYGVLSVFTVRTFFLFLMLLSYIKIASQAFTWGTVAVLPFYTLMVLAPNSKITRKTMESSAPYVLLGFLYAYLLYLSWTPETLRSMFSSKYWLPELPGIAQMFTNEITVASAWIHLLAVDLFAARQVFHDGLKNNVETRHSVSLCLLFCPIGIVTHALTKVLTKPLEQEH